MMGFKEWLINWLCPDYLAMEKTIAADVQIIADLRDKLLAYQTPDPMETYWNTKYPSSVVKYSCRWNDIVDFIDVRWFFNNQIDDFYQIVKPVMGKTNDEKMLFCQLWVRDNIIYATDSSTYSSGEYWADSIETLIRKIGDCEDGAILMTNLALTAGVPYWRVRITAGEVEGGGHAYLTYLSDSQLSKPVSEQNWKVCDWCYYPDVLSFDLRPNYKDEPKYYTDKIWFSFNKKYAFSTQGTTTTKEYKVCPPAKR